jgi:hypothetical protein
MTRTSPAAARSSQTCWRHRSAGAPARTACSSHGGLHANVESSSGRLLLDVNAVSAWANASPPVARAPGAVRYRDDERLGGLRRIDDVDEREWKALGQHAPERPVLANLRKRVRVVLHAPANLFASTSAVTEKRTASRIHARSPGRRALSEMCAYYLLPNRCPTPRHLSSPTVTSRRRDRIHDARETPHSRVRSRPFSRSAATPRSPTTEPDGSSVRAPRSARGARPSACRSA